MKTKLFLKLALIFILMPLLSQTSFAQTHFTKDWIHIGESSIPYGSYNYPVDFYGKTSMSQSIYMKEQINHTACLVTDIEYTYKTVDPNYNNLISGEQFKVWMCNTDSVSLSQENGYWLPLDNFTLVFNGTIDNLPAGENKKFTFHLDNPFVYNESNLCIMIERSLSENSYQNNFNFKASNQPADKTTARLYWSHDTPFDFTDMASQEGMTLSAIVDIDINLSTENGGSLAGTITNNASEPIQDATVKLKNTDLITKTDANGNYSFSYLPLNTTYTVQIEAFGYMDQEADVTITGETTQDFVMQNKATSEVSGKVVDKDNTPLADAIIAVSGYDNYQATTDANGNFTIQNVYYADQYTLICSKKYFKPDTISFDVNSETTTLADITLNDILITPSKIIAQKDGENVTLNWISPFDKVEFRHDGGNLANGAGHLWAEDIAVFGSVFRESAKLFKASWYTRTKEGVPDHKFVSLYVFELDANGMPTNNIIFHKRNIPNQDDQWSHYFFEEPIIAENGFMLALAYNQAASLELGIDDGTDPNYPLLPNTNFISENYTTGVFIPLEEFGQKGNFMVRAEGYNLETGKALGQDNKPKDKNLIHYNVYRFPQNLHDDPTQWTVLSENTTTTNFTDNTFASATENGWYQYAVKSIYSDSQESEPRFSNLIAKGLTTQVTLTITTNTPNNESLGAKVTLINKDDSEKYTYIKHVENSNGNLVFNEVFKGAYSLKIEHENFVTIMEETVDFTTNDTYNQSFELQEDIQKPYNLEVIQGDKIEFNWNVTQTIFDNFESYEDFALAPSGDIAWTYIDMDEKPTIGIQSFTFPNEKVLMSYMIFTPSQTDPVIDVTANPTIAPYSGDKYLCSFGTTYGGNNDYIISPRLNFCKDFKFSFYAKSFDSQPEPNLIKVGYSTTTNNPEDFMWLTESPITLPHAQYTEYSYDLAEDVKYVCINNVSQNGYILMIDDIKLTTEDNSKNNRGFVKYKVFLDDVLQGETNETTFDLEVVDNKATHTAGVVAVYATGESEMATITFNTPTSVDEINENATMIYPMPANDYVSVKGNFTQYCIYDITGKQVKVGTFNNQKINVNNLKNGIYTIKLIEKRKTRTEKLVIKH